MCPDNNHLPGSQAAHRATCAITSRFQRSAADGGGVATRGVRDPRGHRVRPASTGPPRIGGGEPVWVCSINPPSPLQRVRCISAEANGGSPTLPRSNMRRRSCARCGPPRGWTTAPSESFRAELKTVSRPGAGVWSSVCKCAVRSSSCTQRRDGRTRSAVGWIVSAHCRSSRTLRGRPRSLAEI